MHPYATDSSERRSIPLVIAVISVFFAWLLHWFLGTFSITAPWWLDAPSVTGFYAALYSAFDRCGWRLRPLRKIGIVKLPDLNGCWKGYIISSFDDHDKRHEAVITVSQTWTKIIIRLETDYSKSHSVIGAILLEDPAGSIISYEYLNEPKPGAARKMHAHRGTARLLLKDNSFSGEYYTGRDRQNYGELHFQKM